MTASDSVWHTRRASAARVIYAPIHRIVSFDDRELPVPLCLEVSTRAEGSTDLLPRRFLLPPHSNSLPC